MCWLGSSSRRIVAQSGRGVCGQKAVADDVDDDYGAASEAERAEGHPNHTPLSLYFHSLPLGRSILYLFTLTGRLSSSLLVYDCRSLWRSSTTGQQAGECL